MWPGDRFAKLSACLLVISVFVGISRAQNETTVGTVPSSNFADGTISRAVISIAILCGALIICFAVANLLEHFYSKRSIRDDESDMSDYTRELLKAQMLLAFSEPGSLGKQVSAERAARYYANVWRSKVARNNARRLKITKELQKEEENKKAEKKGTVQNKNTTKQVQGKPISTTKPKPALKSKTSTLSDKKVAIKSEARPATGKHVFRTTPMSARAKSNEKTQAANEKPEQTPNIKKTAELSVQHNNKAGNTDNSVVNNKEKDAKLKKETVNSKPINSIMISRRDSEDLQIPIKVSTDEAIKPKGVTFKRENTASSTSEYEFLSSRNKDETRSDPNASAETPKSVSGIVLENKEGSASNKKEIKIIQVKSKLKKPLISSGPQATGNRKAPQTKPQKQNAKV